MMATATTVAFLARQPLHGQALVSTEGPSWTDRGGSAPPAPSSAGGGPTPSPPPLLSCSGPPSLARITVVLLVGAGDMAALGTEGGSVFFLDVPTLMLLEGQTLGPEEVLRR